VSEGAAAAGHQSNLRLQLQLREAINRLNDEGEQALHDWCALALCRPRCGARLVAGLCRS